MSHTHKLAEALLRRKELNAKLAAIVPITQANVFEKVVQRQRVSEGFDEITANVPKLTLSQVMHERDHYSKQLRYLDAAIQQVNWTADVNLEIDCMSDYGDVHGYGFKQKDIK